MRFIVVLVLFSIVAYASCYEDAEQDVLDIDSTELIEDELEEELEEISFADDKLKRKCSPRRCARKCYRFMRPSYRAVCRNNKCACKRFRRTEEN